MLFHSGKFDATAVIETSHALIAYGVGLIGLILVKILAPGFYAKQNIKTPVKIALGVLAATQIMNLIFIPKLAHVGLALSVGLGACLNAGFLFSALKRHNIYRPQPGWGLFFIKQSGALLLMAGCAQGLSEQFDWLGMQHHTLYRIAFLGFILLICVTAYFTSLFGMGFRFRDFKRVTH